MGKSRFRSTRESTPSTDDQINLSRVIKSATPTGQTRRRIFTHDSSNNVDSRKDGLFGICLHCSPFRGHPAKKNKFLGVSRRFHEIEKVHIMKTTASISTKFCTVIKTTKCPSWVIPTHASQIQDGGQPPSWKKSKNRHISAAVREISTRFGTITQFGPLDRSDRCKFKI